VSIYFYCSVRPERLLHYAERDLLATANFLVHTTVVIRDIILTYEYFQVKRSVASLGYYRLRATAELVVISK